MNFLQSPIDPYAFWFRNVGRHIVSPEKLEELGPNPSREEIIKKTLAPNFKRTGKPSSRFNDGEAIIVGEGWFRFFSSTIEFDPQSSASQGKGGMIHEGRALSEFGLKLEVVNNTPKFPFMAISFLQTTAYGANIRVTETRNQIQICNAKSFVTVDLDVMGRLKGLVAEVGAPVIKKALEVRMYYERGHTQFDKARKALDKAIDKAELKMASADLIDAMPACVSGEFSVLRDLLKNRVKEDV